MSRTVFLLCALATVYADVYMHAPRGSNDRNCEKNVNRNNGNRLFDSQNNAKGGYACPRPRVGPTSIVDTMYYHPGSKVVIEWTNQHGCGTNPKTSCEIVLQYACEDTLDPSKKYRSGEHVGAPRDGTPADANDAATDRIPETEAAAKANTAATRRFGMHENNEFYQSCKARSRNRGLYTADQKVNRNGAIGTRQNPNGNRRGLECPEERDYYPYWAPQPWRDIAVITSNAERCPYYKKASQNVAGSGQCMPATSFWPKNHVYTRKCRRDTKKDTQTHAQRMQSQVWYNNKQECESVGHVWQPVWWDIRHPDSIKAANALKDPTVTGGMHYELFENLSPDMLCNTPENVAIEKGDPVQKLPMTSAGWQTVAAGNFKGSTISSADAYAQLKAAGFTFSGNYIDATNAGVRDANNKLCGQRGGRAASDKRWNYFGWAGGNAVGTISKKMAGTGSATVSYGNCWNAGQVNLYHNKAKVASAAAYKWVTHKVEFKDGDVLELKDESGNAVMSLVSFQVTSASAETDPKYSTNAISFDKSAGAQSTQTFKAPLKVEFKFTQTGATGCLKAEVLGSEFGFNTGYKHGSGTTQGTGFPSVDGKLSSVKQTALDPGCYITTPTGCKADKGFRAGNASTGEVVAADFKLWARDNESPTKSWMGSEKSSADAYAQLKAAGFTFSGNYIDATSAGVRDANNKLCSQRGGRAASDKRWNYFGWAGGNAVGTISKKMAGTGSATVSYGNCWNAGQVNLYHNKAKVASAAAYKWVTHKVEFKDGDVLELKDESGNAVMSLVSFQVTLTNTRESSHSNKGICDKRANEYNSYCDINDAKSKFVAASVYETRSQSMAIEIFANKTATYRVNGGFVWHGNFTPMEGSIAWGVGACTGSKLTAVEITQAGIYGMSTKGCADKLRAAVSGTDSSRLTHTYSSIFSGEVTDCSSEAKFVAPKTGSKRTTGCGAPACAYYYTGIGGSSVAQLTQNAKFPQSPDEVVALPATGQFATKTNYGNNYGAMIEGWVKAPATGKFIFITFSDDASQVWLSKIPDTQSGAEIAVQVDRYTGKEQVGTKEFELVKGKSYYVKALVKEGGGGDYLKVGMQAVGGKRYMPLPISMMETDVTTGDLLSARAVRVQRLSGYLVPNENGRFQFSAKGGYGTEIWLDSKKIAVNDKESGARIESQATELTKGKSYKIQAFGPALANPGSSGALDLGVTIGGKKDIPMKTASSAYRICSMPGCGQPARQCQTQATTDCECDNWVTRAPQLGLTAEAGNCCMRPTYSPHTQPWCYCKGADKNKWANCDPKLHPNKGVVQLVDQEEDSWSENSPVTSAQVAEDASASVQSPTVDCVDGYNSMSRENQLGNARNTANPDPAIPHGINANRYIWTVPNHVQDNCVVRLRYNISTSDYPAWANDGTPLTTSAHNSYEKNGGFYGPDGEKTKSPVMQDPYVGFGKDPQKTFLELALNTNQYGRTFQDRSYVFNIKARPAGIAEDAKIYNVNVRGKRGNIVQTYPAVEYDFVPNDLCLDEKDYVHFQWTGSDYNPQRNPNDGAGAGDVTDTNQASRADRSNLVELDVTSGSHTMPTAPRTNNEGPFPESLHQNAAGKRSAEVAAGTNYPAGVLSKWDQLGTNYRGMFWTKDGKPDEATIMKLAFIDQVERLRATRKRCKTLEELLATKDQNRRERDPANCAKLNGAHEPYFDGGLVQMRKTGKFSYFSSRNNNFSNRDQKGFICVGKGMCSAGKGCQATVEDDLRKKQKKEAADGTEIEPGVGEDDIGEGLLQLACDDKCQNAQLREQVESLKQQIKSMKL